MRLFLAVLLPLLALVAGCGSESESDRVQSVLRTYIEHYIDSEPAEMYGLLDSGSRELCTEERFVAFISAAREALGEREFEIVAIRDVVIDGDSATATVESSIDGEAAEPTENTLIKEEGTWRLQLPSIGC